MKLHSPKDQHAENRSPARSLPPPAFQLKAAENEARSPEPDQLNGGLKDYSNWQNGHMYVAVKHADGNFTETCIVQFKFNDKERKWEYRYTAEFDAAFGEHSELKLFKECFTEAMKSKLGKQGSTAYDGGHLEGLRYWIRDQSGTKTVIGIFDDDEVKIDTARTFYHVNEKNLGKTLDDNTGKVKVDKNDPSWKTRMPDFDPEQFPDMDEKEIADAREGVDMERQDALSDLALFDGLDGNKKGMNLSVTRRSTWQGDGGGLDGKTLLLHEIMSHLSIPEYERGDDNQADPEVYNTNYQHTKSSNSGVPLDTHKHDH